LIEAVIDPIVNQLLAMGYTGIYAIMFLAGSVLPVPWELILLPIGSYGYDPFYASILAGLGASLGASVGFYLGQIIGRPILIKYGKYALILENDIIKGEKWINKWGAPTTLLLRSLQYMPYKTYNFIAGLSKMNFKSYMILTIIGTTFRCAYMIYLGKITNINPTTTIIITIIIVLVTFILPLARKNKTITQQNLKSEIQ